MSKSPSSGQASLEYMIMLAMSLAIFSAILYVISTLISGSGAQVGINSAYLAVSRIKEAADMVYVHGHPSKVQINVYVPQNIEDVTVSGNLVNLRVAMGSAFTDVYSVTRGNITGNFTLLCQPLCREGYYVLSVSSTDPGGPKAGIIEISDT